MWFLKQQKRIIGLAVMVVILFALYVILGKWNDHQEEKEAEKEKEETVYVTEEEDITKLSYKTGAEIMSFTKTNDQWVYDTDTKIPMDQDAVQTVADAVGSLIAVRELSNPDELSDYGLDAPSYTINYTREDGSSEVLNIGNAVGDNYYASKESGESVYTVSGDLLSNFEFDIAAYVKHEEVPSIGSDNLKKVIVETKGEKTEYTEEEQLEQLAGGFGALTLEDCANYHATEKELKSYGLDQANRTTVTAVYEDSNSEEKEFVLYIGNVSNEESEDSSDEFGLDESEETDEEITRYIVRKDSDMVYLEGEAVIENMTVYDEDEVSETEE